MPLEKHIQNEDIYTPKLEGLMMEVKNHEYERIGRTACTTRI